MAAVSVSSPCNDFAFFWRDSLTAPSLLRLLLLRLDSVRKGERSRLPLCLPLFFCLFSPIASSRSRTQFASVLKRLVEPAVPSADSLAPVISGGLGAFATLSHGDARFTLKREEFEGLLAVGAPGERYSRAEAAALGSSPQPGADASRVDLAAVVMRATSSLDVATLVSIGGTHVPLRIGRYGTTHNSPLSSSASVRAAIVSPRARLNSPAASASNYGSPGLNY